MARKHDISRFDPEGTRLPIKLDTTSNGEFAPLPLPRHSALANQRALEQVGINARRLGMSRRDCVTTSAGTATTLLAFNEAHAALGRTGSYYDVPRLAALDAAAAEKELRDLLEESPEVVLAGKLEPEAGRYRIFRAEEDYGNIFTGAADHLGLVNVVTDEDGVLRRYMPFAFASATTSSA